MDPVSNILAERERSRPRMLPWVVLATALHGCIVAAAFLFGRAAAARPVHLPAVSVKLIRPERPPGRPAAQRPPAPKPAAATPKPTAVPTAAATPVPRPEPEPTAPTQSRPSEDAMAAPDAVASPAPTAAAPEPEPGGGGGSGLSVGGGDGGQVPGIPADFQFTYYIERMLALIESRWYKPAVPPGTRARVRFRIQRDGRLDQIELEGPSGQSSFDRAALRALYASNPLPPLPPGYGKSSLTVHLSFAE